MCVLKKSKDVWFCSLHSAFDIIKCFIRISLSGSPSIVTGEIQLYEVLVLCEALVYASP